MGRNWSWGSSGIQAAAATTVVVAHEREGIVGNGSWVELVQWSRGSRTGSPKQAEYFAAVPSDDSKHRSSA